MNEPTAITTETALEERLSRPTPLSTDAMRQLEGDLLILGAGGKMGPSLARLARRSADEAGRSDLRVIAVSRFSSPQTRQSLEDNGLETISCDFSDPAACNQLPQVPNVLFMFGHKFSQDDAPGVYWVMNTCVPAALAQQFQHSRIVCFSSGNVYPFTPIGEPAPTEDVEPAPRGEYATTVWGRERVLQYVSSLHQTPVCLLRLNYAVEARYGVLVDIGDRLLRGEKISLGVPEMNFVWQGYANAVSLAAFGIVGSPADILNLTGLKRHRTRDLAAGLARRLGVEPQFIEPEGETALVSDATRCQELFGSPDVDDEQLLDLTAAWLKSGGRTLGKPTKFEVRDGKY